MRPARTILLAGLLCALVGCKSSEIIGGTSEETAGEISIEVELVDGSNITITDSRETTAATQPSVTVKGSDAAPAIGATTRPSDFGGYSFEFPPAVQRTLADKNARWFALFFLICAGACVWMRRYLMAGVCLAVGVLAAFHPTSLIIGAVVVVVVVLWLLIRNIQQVGRGIQKADQQTPPSVSIAGFVREEVDRATQQMIGIASPTPAPVTPGSTPISGVVVGETTTTPITGEVKLDSTQNP